MKASGQDKYGGYPWQKTTAEYTMNSIRLQGRGPGKKGPRSSSVLTLSKLRARVFEIFSNSFVEAEKATAAASSHPLFRGSVEREDFGGGIPVD
jgi:hypothetical protein